MHRCTHWGIGFKHWSLSHLGRGHTWDSSVTVHFTFHWVLCHFLIHYSFVGFVVVFLHSTGDHINTNAHAQGMTWVTVTLWRVIPLAGFTCLLCMRIFTWCCSNRATRRQEQCPSIRHRAYIVLHVACWWTWDGKVIVIRRNLIVNQSSMGE